MRRLPEEEKLLAAFCSWISLIVPAMLSGSTGALRGGDGAGAGSNAGLTGSEGRGMAAGSSTASAVAAKTAMRGGFGNSTSGVRSGGGAVDENDVRREVELDAELRVPVMSGRKYSRSM